MPHFSEKHCTYRLGCLCVILGFVGYAVAFGMPTWELIVIDNNTDDLVYGGLWQHTCYGLSNCQSYPVIVDDPPFQTVRSLACISIAFYFISVCLVLLHNCTAYGRKVQTENKIVSLLPFLSGLCGVVSCAFYAAMNLASDSGTESIAFHLAWAFGVGTCCNIFGLVGGVLMLTGSYKDRQRVIRETEMNQNMTHSAPQTSSTTPMALVAVPVSYLSNSGSMANIPMALVATDPNAVSGVARNYTTTSLVQSSEPATEPAPTTAPAHEPPVPQAQETPRPDPSAPPPEFHDFYY